jgi:hypothetical protein
MESIASCDAKYYGSCATIFAKASASLLLSA